MPFLQFNLNPKILKALSACGYTTPTPIQTTTIPSIMDGKDLVASAQTGTGKTAAFVLPALHHLSLSKAKIKPRILILTPTRELAAQVTQAASKYGKFLNFRIISLVGGMPYRQQLRDLSKPIDIIVATPGRLLDHLSQKRLDLSAIEILVLDEADRMLDMGFIDDVKTIARATPNQRQTLLFSATVDDKLAPVIRQLLKNPIRVDLSQKKMAPALIKQEIYRVDNPQHKSRLLQHFLANGNIFKAIIFSGTKINADKLVKQLREQGFEAAPLHGNLKQMQRNKTVERFRSDKLQFLVATDVAARGIDINDVTHVINYDLPKFAEDYVHRIGRTGRAGKNGVAISFVLHSDSKHLQRIERFMKQKLDFSTVPGFEAHSSAEKTSHQHPKQRSTGKQHQKNFPKKTKQRYSENTYENAKPPRFVKKYAEGKHFSAKKKSAPSEHKEHAFKGRGYKGKPTRDYDARSEGRPARNHSARFEERPARHYSARSEERPARHYGARSEGRPARDHGARSEGRPARDHGARSEGRPARNHGARSEGRPARNHGARFEGRPAREHGARSEGRPARNHGARSEGRSTRDQDRPTKKHHHQNSKPHRHSFAKKKRTFKK